MIGDIDGIMLKGMNPDQETPALDSTDKPSQDGPLPTKPRLVRYWAQAEQLASTTILPINQRWDSLAIDHRYVRAGFMFAGLLLAAAMAIGGDRV